LYQPDVIVVIPTLAADFTLAECLGSLESQTFKHFESVVVDNSGKGLARAVAAGFERTKVIENSKNAGFGAAVNQGVRASRAPLIATLNDDATASAAWLSELVAAARANPRAGLFASQVRLLGEEQLDSAGMLLCADGSSKQRGHGQAAADYALADEPLLPSGSAALYRREMLDRIGGFDEDFFLYCEDTDLGLRARWAGWRCLYVPTAVVHHRYSHSAGRASALKAYYVERNRLFVVAKNFPAMAAVRAPFVSIARYAWHTWFLIRGEGTAGRFAQGGSGFALAWFVLKAHLALIASLGALLSKRRAIRRTARLSDSDFMALMRAHSISARQVAAL
jgi:GT2 family glycosyltransferase